jgi:Flp pilus assembly protein TadB
VGSFATDQDDLWQAIAAGMIFTLLVTVYPGVGSSLSLFAGTFIVQFTGVILMLLLMHMILRVSRQAAKIPAFCGAVFMD